MGINSAGIDAYGGCAPVLKRVKERISEWLISLNMMSCCPSIQNKNNDSGDWKNSHYKVEETLHFGEGL